MYAEFLSYLFQTNAEYGLNHFSQSAIIHFLELWRIKIKEQFLITSYDIFCV